MLDELSGADELDSTTELLLGATLDELSASLEELGAEELELGTAELLLETSLGTTLEEDGLLSVSTELETPAELLYW